MSGGSVWRLDPAVAGLPLLNRVRAQQVMDDFGLDVLVGSTPQNVQYLADYQSHGQWLMPASHAFAVLHRDPSRPVSLVVSVGEMDRVSETPPAAEHIEPYGRFYLSSDEGSLGELEERVVRNRARVWRDSPAAALASVMSFLDLPPGATVGLDDRGILPNVRTAIHESLSEFKIVDGYGPLQRIRMVKSPKEVALLRRAANVAEVALTTVTEAFRPGITERELVRIYERVVLDEGARPTFSHILIGARGALSNGDVSDAVLSPGQVVRFDVGCSVGSYNSDIARTAVLGKAPVDVRNYYDAILAGEDAGLAALRPGVSAGAIFEAAVSATRQAGIPHYERNHVGHGIGIELYDPPIIVANEEIAVEEGMVLNVETPYYSLGWTGIQIEDTVVVTHEGYDMFTTIPRTLIEV